MIREARCVAPAEPPLSIYVHFPWCVRKCPYCDFNSYTLHGPLEEARYVAALARDLECQAAQLEGRSVISVFMGGGTPSLFSPEAIGSVLRAIRSAFGVDTDLEVTLETNPGAVERGAFGEYRAAGVTRVSLGAQTFDSGHLAALGRIHSAAETHRAAEELHAAALTNFNLDLMYGLPGQTPAQAVLDLDTAISLSPAHISHYQLTLEPGTVFAARRPELPDDDAAAQMLAACADRLTTAGFEQYEVSAYARGSRCRHNLNYWSFGDYVGVGAGAHGKLSFLAEGAIFRTAHAREPRRYLTRPADSPHRVPVAQTQRPFEFMLNALRLIDGFEEAHFEARTGLAWKTIASRMQALESRGLVHRSRARWCPSPLGLRFLNDVLLHFLPETSARAERTGLSTVD